MHKVIQRTVVASEWTRSRPTEYDRIRKATLGLCNVPFANSDFALSSSSAETFISGSELAARHVSDVPPRRLPKASPA